VACAISLPAIGLDPQYRQIAPEILAEIGEERLPPAEELPDSGLLPVSAVTVKSEVIEQGYITHWLSHGECLIGSLDEDLIGEGDIQPVCYGNRLTEHEDAPNMYRYTWSAPECWTYYYYAYDDDELCETIYTDQVRYFFTQVKSDKALNALALVGADDGIKLWLNGDVVMRHDGGDYAAGQYQAPVQLVAGWNMIVIKVHYPLLGPSDHPDYEPRAFSLRFATPDGSNPIILTQAVDGWCDHEQSYQWVHAGGAADLSGAFGSQWASDLSVINPYPYPLELTVHYFEEGNVRVATPKHNPPAPKAAIPDAEKMIVLDPYESRLYESVLTSLLEVTPPQKGMLAIRGFYNWDAEGYGAAKLKTYNQSDGGTFGSEIRFTDTYEGYTCCSQMIHGLRNGPDFRTNIAMTPRRYFDDEVEFTVTVFDRSTGLYATQDFVGRGYFQVNDIFARLGVSDAVTDNASAHISWSNTDNGARIYFSASVVDNHTSDPLNFYRGVWTDVPDAP
jgi:hypothetical protein